MSAKSFVLSFLGLSLLALGLIALFNRVVDPFWYYRDLDISGFNAIKTKFARFERHVKPALLVREQSEAIVLGSSYSEIGFDPDHPDFSKQGQLKSMNFALAGAMWQMVQCQFEFAVKHAPIKRALIGLHIGSIMPMADCSKDFPNIGNINSSELLLSQRALAASMQTVLGQRKAKPSHTRSGMYFYTRDKKGVRERFQADFLRIMQGKLDCLTPAAIDYLPPTLTASHFDLSGLAHVIQLAEQHNVELVFFAYPLHATALELEQQCGLLHGRWDFLLQVAKLNEQQHRPASIWQFYDYNDITAEPVSDTMRYWQDAAHFNFEAGNVMLNTLFGHEHTWGKRVTVQTLEQDYSQFFQRRTEFLKQSDLQKQLQQLNLGQ